MNKLKKIITAFTLISVMAFLMVNLSSAQTLNEMDEAAKLKYNESRQSYLKEIEAYKAARLNFSNAKTKLQGSRTAENKTEYKVAVQEFLSKTVSTLSKYMEALKNKAENIRGISDENRKTIVSRIDKDIAWLAAEQSKLSEKLTDEELKSEAAKINNYWLNIKTTFKQSVAEIWIGRVTFVIEKAQDFSDKVSYKIQEMKTNGDNTAKLENWLADIDQNILKAKEKVGLASEKRTNISDVNMDRIMKDINQFVKDANLYIAKSHSTLVQIIQEMKIMAKTEKIK